MFLGNRIKYNPLRWRDRQPPETCWRVRFHKLPARWGRFVLGMRWMNEWTNRKKKCIWLQGNSNFSKSKGLILNPFSGWKMKVHRSNQTYKGITWAHFLCISWWSKENNEPRMKDEENLCICDRPLRDIINNTVCVCYISRASGWTKWERIQ